jgi:2-amino-4-hydroxy-6-hydroxymethyldihydropteridine diphosphokinase
LHERRFVLAPLCELAPDWRHPRLGTTATALLAALPPGQPVQLLGD